MPPPIAPATPSTGTAIGAAGPVRAPAAAKSFAPPTAPTVIAPPRPAPCKIAKSRGSAWARSSSFRRSSITLKIFASSALIFS
jgi:hypothetical protein